jgi:hypothetical protein
VYVSEQWRSNIGSPTGAFIADVDVVATSLFRYAAASGGCWYTPGGVSTTCTLLRNVGTGILAIIGTGTLTRLESGKGTTLIGPSIVVPTIQVGGGYVYLDGAAGTAPTTVEVAGGTYHSKRGIGTSITIWGGKVLFDSAANTIATLTMASSNGLLNIVQSGTITTFNFIAGDARNITIARPITITNTVIWSTVKNASAFLDEPLITFSNTPTWRIDQGTL